MELKTLQNHENRRPLLIAVKYLLVAAVIFCSIGIVSAANDTKITLYTSDDMDNAQKIIDDSGVGIIIALVALTAQYAPILAGVLLVILAIVARIANNADAHKGALKGIMFIIGIMFVWVIFIAIVSRTTPDISTITFGG